jgi:hypothetical protein
VFVVFSQKAQNNKVELVKVEEKVLRTVGGSWNVAFQPHRGAPANAVFENLNSYTENADAGIKYFSGTALYTKTFMLEDAAIQKGKLVIDLGEVKNLAEVIINGKNLGVVWKKPFRLNISDAVKAGENQLEIKVVNLWVNRLIGDLQPEAKEKITYTTIPFYQPNSPLQPSGLLGPVNIISYSN